MGGKSDVEQLEGILSQFSDEDIIAALVKKGINLSKGERSSEKQKLVKSISSKVKIDEQNAKIAVNEVLAEIVSPYVFRKPGGEVGLLDNSCRNNCKNAALAKKIK